jgi:regulator of protease activity HflC (stomatin/prohibitin superfamily)
VSTAASTVAAFVVVLAIFVVVAFVRAARIIPQGFIGVVQRLGKYRGKRTSGVAFIVPFIDRLTRVDMREMPHVGDHQDVITKDNVVVQVNATIYMQVVDAVMALFEVSNYMVAIEQLARTALRAVFGSLSLDEALSERQAINAQLQDHMGEAVEKWGVRVNRVEILDIVPPQNIVNAMALQKEADQRKRAAILQSEGEKQSAINAAEGEKQAAILRAQAQRQAQIEVAEGERQAQIARAEGQARAIELVYRAIDENHPSKEVLSVLQMQTMQQVATSPNAKLVVPVETAGLVGAAQLLKEAFSG